MNHGVAANARHNLRRTGIHPVHRSARDRAVALVAQLIDIGNIQQPCVLGAMRCVAAQATFRLHRGMFEHKRPTRLGVALGADHVLIGGGLDLIVAKGAVSVVAVAALHQAFIHPVVEGFRERRLDIGVAGIAKLRLCGDEEFVFTARRVHAMATGAAYAGFGMGRPVEVGMRAGMASEARRIDHLGRGFAQLKDLGDIAAGLHMGLAWAVAALTGGAGTAVQQGQLGVRIVRKLFCQVAVAQSAGLRSNEAVWRRCGAFLRYDCFGLLRKGDGWRGTPETSNGCEYRQSK